MSLHASDMQPTLQSERVILRPLTDQDFEALYAVAADPEIWAMHPYRDRYKREVFEDFFADAMASGGAFVVVYRAEGKIIGGTRFGNYSAVDGEIEIGWTFFATAYWRTGINREVKALMLRHIFPHVRTVVFQIGATNFRSRTAVERIGGRLTREYVRTDRGDEQDYTRYELTERDARAGSLADYFFRGERNAGG